MEKKKTIKFRMINFQLQQVGNSLLVFNRGKVRIEVVFPHKTRKQNEVIVVEPDDEDEIFLARLADYDISQMKVQISPSWMQDD